MEDASLFNITSCFFTLILALLIKSIVEKHKRSPRNLPPSPPALPIIGHLHLLKEPVHRTLHELSQKYGPVLYLKFGTRKVLAVSSISGVEECFTKNDIIFANRPQLLIGKHLNYNYGTLAFAPCGDYWRNLRRFTALGLFSTSKIAMFASIRQEEVQLMLKELFLASAGSKKAAAKVEVTSKLIDVVFNMMLRVIVGKRYYGKHVEDEEEAKQFREILRDYLEMDAGSYFNDSLPFLQLVDFQGAEKRMKEIMKKMDNFLQSLVEEQRRSIGEGDYSKNTARRKPTLIHDMLSLQQTEPEFYTDETIKGVVLQMMITGTETLSTTIVWAMSLLLNHPEVMHKAWKEMGAKVGGKFLDETDLPKLNYLQSIISETFRLFPPTPLLLPHESSEDCNVCGYDVPKGTMLLINAWSIQRDPKLWEDSTRFMPERFQGGEGEGYKLIPFGVGRRACPGTVLGRKAVGLALGALIQSFEWNRTGMEEIDMKEGTGLTMSKAEPLVALCAPRPEMINLLSTL